MSIGPWIVVGCVIILIVFIVWIRSEAKKMGMKQKQIYWRGGN